MDTRHRTYYFVNLNQNRKIGGWWRPGWDNCGIVYDSNLRILKRSIASLKFMSVGPFYHSNLFQMKLSCKKEDEDLLVDVLDKLPSVNYLKLV